MKQYIWWTRRRVFWWFPVGINSVRLPCIQIGQSSANWNDKATVQDKINDISSQWFFFCKSLKKNPNWRQPLCHIKDSIWYITQQIPESKYKSSWHKLSRVVKSVAHHSSKHGTCYYNNCTMNSNIWDVLSMVCFKWLKIFLPTSLAVKEDFKRLDTCDQNALKWINWFNDTVSCFCGGIDLNFIINNSLETI